ncbi:MAG: ATP-binding protein [Anaerolineae bacterium]
MRRVLEISRHLIFGRSLQQLWYEIAQAAIELTDSQAAGLLLEDPVTGKLRFQVATSSTEQLLEIPGPLEGSIAAAAFFSGEPVLADGSQADSRIHRAVEQAIGSEALSVLAVPIVFEGRRIGALEVETERGTGGFEAEDIEILRLLAGQAAVAIKSARRNGELTSRIAQGSAELRAANEKLRREMAERAQAEMALRRQNTFLKTVIDSLPHPFYVVDVADYTVQLANKAAGGSSSEGATCYAAVHGADQPCSVLDCLCPLDEVRRTGRPVVVEHIRRDADGEEWYAAIHCYPVVDQDRGVVQVIEYSIDVTEQRIAQAERERWLALLRSTLETTADGILLVDRLGQVILHNRRLEEMWQLPPGWADLVSLDERLPFPASLVVNPEVVTRSVYDLYQHPMEEHRDLIELRDGRFLETYSAPFWAGEEILGRVWDFHDVTERVRAERALRQLNETLEEQVASRTQALEAEMEARERLEAETAELQLLKEIDRLRSEFISNVSHELRTPLGLIKAAATTLLAEDVSFDAPTQQRLLEGMDDEADRLEHLISNLLTLSRVEQQRLLLDRRPTDLARLIRQTVGAQRTFRSTSPTAPVHRFVCDLPPDELMVSVDARRVEQVMRNLLTNAVKYSPAGSAVRIRARQAADHVLVQVRDEGIGIAPEDQEHLFERFYRVESAAIEAVTGVGLGLAISREIVEAHGGRIWVESDAGSGSVFSFTIPLTKALPRDLSCEETEQEVQ